MNRIESLNPIGIELRKKNILSIHETLKIELPNPIKELLTNFNIAKPLYTYYNENNVEFNLNYFFGYSDKKHEDFIHNFNTFLHRIPDELLPIGSIDGGDLLCMDKKEGFVYYWFHEEDDWGIEGNKKLPVKVADSLDEFLNCLVASEKPTKEEIERAKKQAKITKTTPIALKFKNQARAKKGLPPLTMKDFE